MNAYYILNRKTGKIVREFPRGTTESMAEGFFHTNAYRAPKLFAYLSLFELTENGWIELE